MPLQHSGLLDPLATSPAVRLAVGAALAGIVAVAARRAGALATSGAAAAVVAGAIASAAGWVWAFLLIAYFLATSGLTRLGAAAKQARTRDVVAKGGARDWRQVAANGGVFTIAAGLWLGTRDPAVAALGAGSLAAAAADSWGTELGTLVRQAPRSILTLRRVPPGTSGGVSAAGTAATLAGAGFVALVAWALGWPSTILPAVVAGGFAGAMVDSLLGAVVQSRRWCPACETGTEQQVHRCGTPTDAAGGVRWVDNDVVNVACAAAGGLLAMLLAA